MPVSPYIQRAKKVRMYYDPLGNVVKTVNPDNTEQRIVKGIPVNITQPPTSSYKISGKYKPSPWENYTYDVNDLAPITHPVGSGVPTEHTYTPKSSTLDGLGRTIQTIDRNGANAADEVVMQYEYDIRGNLKKVTDALDRTAFSHVYDLRPKQKNEQGEEQPLTPIWTYHIDKGISKVLADALGKPIETSDAKGAQVLSAFDTLNRPIKIWAKDKASETVTIRQVLVYGDSAGLANPENQNLKGRLYKHYDEAGLTIFSEYDFKGNTVEKTRRVIKDEEILSVFDGPPPDWQINCYRVNWLPPPPMDLDDYADSILDAVIYQTNTEYDALNRVTKFIYPEDLDTERKELLPAYNKAGALEKVTLGGDNYVEHIAYNAKGQRLLIAFGNNTMTRYCYDNSTFRLARLKSEKYTFTKVGNIHTYTPYSGTRQDYGYKYDLAGNIIQITDKTPDSGVTANPDELTRNFSYDPLYRLLSATGRECNTPAASPWEDIAKCTDINDRRLYTQKYSYDKMGNMLTLQNIAPSNTYTREFNYTTDNNYLNSIDIGGDNFAFTFDENGNQITENSSRKFEWDYSDKLRCFYNQAGTSEPSVYEHYLYDGQGNRTKKLTRKSGGNIEVSIYIDGILDHQYHKNSTGTVTAENNTLHIMDDKSRIANLLVGTAFSGDTTPEIQYNLEDHLGSSNVRIDENGTVIDRDEFYPFGETSLHTFDKKRYRYVGKERDEYSGMYYYGARYYSAWTCRFVSVDPLAKDYAYFTPYNYAGNKPVSHKDLEGLQSTGDKAIQPSGNNISGTIYLQSEVDQNGNPLLNNSQLTQYGDYAVHNINDIYSGQNAHGHGPTQANVQYQILQPGQSVNLGANQVLWTVGLNGDSKVNRNTGFMNFNQRGNTAAHEFGHHLGLSDRYNYWQDVVSGRVSSSFETTDMFLPQSYDPQYFGNETANLMNHGNVITDMQWDIIFSSRSEHLPQNTFFSHYGNGTWNSRTGNATLGLDSKGGVSSRTAGQGDISRIGNRFFNAETQTGSNEGRFLWDYKIRFEGRDTLINRDNMLMPYTR